MKVDRKKIVESLEIAAPALCANPLVPAFQCFHVKGNSVVSTDGIMIINSLLDKNTNIDCLIPGIPFFHLVKSLKEDHIELVEEGDSLCVKTKNIKGIFVLTDKKDYMIDTSDEKVDWNKCLPSFLDGLNYCRYNVSSDETSLLGGVCIRNNNIYGTDRYRIMRYRFQETKDVLVESFVLPVKFVNTILSIRERITHTGLCLSKKKFMVKLDNGSTISTSFSTEKYPELDQHLEIETKDFQKIQFPEDIIDVLNRHIDFQKTSSEELKKVNIKIDGNDCEITTIEPELGILKESLSIPIKIDAPLEFIMNPLFLKDIMKITMEFFCCPEKCLVLFLTTELESIVKTMKYQYDNQGEGNEKREGKVAKKERRNVAEEM